MPASRGPGYEPLRAVERCPTISVSSDIILSSCLPEQSDETVTLALEQGGRIFQLGSAELMEERWADAPWVKLVEVPASADVYKSERGYTPFIKLSSDCHPCCFAAELTSEMIELTEQGVAEVIKKDHLTFHINVEGEEFLRPPGAEMNPVQLPKGSIAYITTDAEVSVDDEDVLKDVLRVHAKTAIVITDHGARLEKIT